MSIAKNKEWVFVSMKKRNFLLVSLVMVVLLVFSIGIMAGELDELKEQKKSLNQQMDSTEQELNTVQGQRKTTEEQLNVLEEELATLAAEIADLEAQLAQAQADYDRQEAEYEQIQANLNASQDQMQTRVTSIYVNGDISYWDILFNAESFDDLISNFYYYERILEQDRFVINDIKEKKRLAQEKLAELEQTRNAIAALTDSKQAQEAEYMAQADQKSALVAQLEEQEEALEEALAQFAADSAEIQAKINTLTSNSSVAYTGNGQFGWPVPSSGSVSSYYGTRIHPITGKQSFHTGIDIPAGSGATVAAAESGKVIYVGYMAAYGNSVLVDHGGGYSTFYAHLSSFDVGAGQTVSRGQRIGGVGTTGWSTGNHLHFEIRINGAHKNPLSYL